MALSAGETTAVVTASSAEMFDLVPLDQGLGGMRVMVHARDAYGNLDETCDREVVVELEQADIGAPTSQVVLLTHGVGRREEEVGDESGHARDDRWQMRSHRAPSPRVWGEDREAGGGGGVAACWCSSVLARVSLLACLAMCVACTCACCCSLLRRRCHMGERKRARETTCVQVSGTGLGMQVPYP